MEIFARQGDLVIEKLTQKINDGDLVKRADVVFAGDSSGHRHRLLGVALFAPASGRTQRFRVLEPTQLVHEKGDGHRTVEMVPGDYEIRPLRERGDQSDRAVED